MRTENGTGGTATASRPESERPPLRRADVYQRPVVDGGERPAGAWTRLLDLGRGLLTSRAEREEADLEGRLRAAGSVTRCNTIAVLSPKGGVGKTTCTFLLGNTLASHLNLRCLAIDADPDFGTLGSLPREEARSERSIIDLLEELDTVSSSAELRQYVSVFPTGLHVLAAPSRAELMAAMTPEHYGALTAFLGRFYDVLLLDLGTGVAGPLACFAIERADQSVVITTPDWVTASTVLRALEHVGSDERVTLVLNQAPREGTGALEAELRRRGVEHRVTIPYDARLGTMLDSGTYSLSGLERGTRVPVKRLGLSAAELLV
jgi:MinD-like ATPase involved in chromosome partitioning or flagellar assembly